MFSGESKAASWRTQTPLLTTASTEQPTEQWLQTVCLISVFGAAAGAGSAADAGSMTFSGRWRATAAAPAVTPAPTRNLRRFRPLSREVFTRVMAAPQILKSPVGGRAVVTADVFGFVVALRLGRSLGRRRGRRSFGGAGGGGQQGQG